MLWDQALRHDAFPGYSRQPYVACPPPWELTSMGGTGLARGPALGRRGMSPPAGPGQRRSASAEATVGTRRPAARSSRPSMRCPQSEVAPVRASAGDPRAGPAASGPHRSLGLGQDLLGLEAGSRHRPRLARAPGRRDHGGVVVIDTENRRARHYADQFAFQPHRLRPALWLARLSRSAPRCGSGQASR